MVKHRLLAVRHVLPDLEEKPQVSTVNFKNNLTQSNTFQLAIGFMKVILVLRQPLYCQLYFKVKFIKMFSTDVPLPVTEICIAYC